MGKTSLPVENSWVRYPTQTGCPGVTPRGDQRVALGVMPAQHLVATLLSARPPEAFHVLAGLVVNGDAMAEDHFATLPSREQNDQDGDEGQGDAERHNRAGPIAKRS